MGTYVSIEPFHLFRYLDEESFRYNERKSTDAERFHKVLGLCALDAAKFMGSLAFSPVLSHRRGRWRTALPLRP